MEKKVFLSIFSFATFLLLFGSMLFVSCTHNKMNLIPDVSLMSTKVEMRNGMVAFPSKEVFVKEMQYLSENQDKLGAWEAQFNGFTSMRSVYNQQMEVLNNYENANTRLSSDTVNLDSFLYQNRHLLTTKGQGEEKEIVRHVDDELLATVVNQIGMVQIADSVYKITYDSVRVAIASNATSLLNGRSSNLNVQFQHYKTVQRMIGESSCIQSYTYGGKNRRMIGGITSVNVGIYTSIGVAVKHQVQGRLGVWWRNKAKKLRIQGTISYNLTITPTNIANRTIDTGWSEDDGREGITLLNSVIIQNSYRIRSSNMTYSCQGDDSNYRSCNKTYAE